MRKKILGLDLGTNSIGWALIDQDFENRKGEILGMGSRIIPMDAGTIGKFAEGSSISQTAERTRYRSARKGNERHHLRRERLHRILNILEFLPKHYAAEIDFEKRIGKFIEETEPKLAWKKNREDQFEFLFQEAFQEMIDDFKKNQPDLLNRKNKKGEDAKIPYDWTIYYLRKKALTQKLAKEELGWLILNFNQKRGYYQLRGEEEETTDKREYVEILKIVKIEKGEIDKKNDKRVWYNLTLGNGWIYSATFTTEPQWLNSEKEFLITEELDQEGNIKTVLDKRTDKIGREKRKIMLLPSFEEIDLMSKNEQDKIYKKIKAKTELSISQSGETVGTYIYETLLRKPNQKIRGKLVRTIERKFYKDELRQILKKQIELQPDFFSDELFNDCVRELYRNNQNHQLQLTNRDFVHFFLDDIIFYQRPLRSQKSSIGNCSIEYRVHKINKKDENGNPIKNSFEKDQHGADIEIKEYLKSIPKSNPHFQEFRIWQLIKNLSIYKRDDDRNVTNEFLDSTEDFEKLFNFLNERKEIEQKVLIKYLVELEEQKNKTGLKGKALSAKAEKYRWNYVDDKKYPCNETGYEIRRRFEKVENIAKNFLTREMEQKLWHLIYSVTDKTQFEEKALPSFARKYNLEEKSFVEAFKKFPPFKSDYGSYSEKAIKKLLPLMRLGRAWSWDAIDEKTKKRIEKIITGEYDETIKDRVREKSINLTQENHFQGLPEWAAKYVVYDRHSEASEIGKWNSAKDLETFVKKFKQHSLRNPIVEQLITETLRVVKDIWKNYGNGAENFFNEIHIELGRDMKNPAEKRKEITSQITENENTNHRIKLLLAELKKDSTIEGTREYSPMQQEILKIYEDGVLNSGKEIPDYVIETLKKFKESDQNKRPTSSEITRYKLWLGQKYQSPYTGQMIPLSKLFTPAYEIEHIIPQSRFFDDSLSNKVICEAAVNQLKDKQLGLEFIKNHHGQKIQTGFGETVEILTEEAYNAFVKEHYEHNRSKRNKLLLEEIPEKMIERQMNDTRYISKYIMSLLSNIVRSEKDDDGVNSKNIIPGNGNITSKLRQDWGLNDVWNELILPRFKRMNELTKSERFTTINKEGHTIPVIPMELSKGFQKKRIDHRHHAMDALVIACATRDHINYLNNENTHTKGSTEKGGFRYDLKNKLCYKKNTDEKGNYRWIFKKPWDYFIEGDEGKENGVKDLLEKITISFKQNLRVINKATNHYEKIENDRKIEVEQKGVNWAIRKPMHKETVSGKVNLRRIKVPREKIITATRKKIDTSFNKDTINSITDTGIQKILRNYLAYTLKRKKTEIIANYQTEGKYKQDLLNTLLKNPAEFAFTPEGIEDLNKNISKFNNGTPHQPVYKARIFEMGSKFKLGEKGNKKYKYVEAAKGTNLFFAVYQDESGNRNFETIPLNIVIERQKQGLISVPEINEKGYSLCPECRFLSPNDLVYVPMEEERENFSSINFGNLNMKQLSRIYKVVSFSDTDLQCLKSNIAHFVVPYNRKLKDKGEIGWDNKSASTIEGDVTIKEFCVKLNVDRLGNINPA